MKTFRCCLVLVLLSLFPLVSFSQTFGLKAGYSLSDMLMKDGGDNVSDELSARSGFHFGPTMEFEINENFSIETAFLFTTKGISMSESESVDNVTFSSDLELNLFYMDIPVYAKAYVDFGSVRLYGMLGPYVAAGLTGKIKMEGSAGPGLYSEEDDISWGSGEEDDLKRLAAGIALGGGVHVHSLLFEVSTHLGLSNLSPHSEYDLIAKNRLFMVTVAYSFGE